MVKRLTLLIIAIAICRLSHIRPRFIFVGCFWENRCSVWRQIQQSSLDAGAYGLFSCPLIAERWRHYKQKSQVGDYYSFDSWRGRHKPPPPQK